MGAHCGRAAEASRNCALVKKSTTIAHAAETDERRTDTRERVLKVAARHFAEHSFSGTSLRAIQREVKVNPATVHYYFGSKEALYQAVIGEFLDRIQAERLARLQQVPANLSGRERLEHARRVETEAREGRKVRIHLRAPAGYPAGLAELRVGGALHTD